MGQGEEKEVNYSPGEKGKKLYIYVIINSMKQNIRKS